MITKADQDIYNFLQKFKNATTYQIYCEFFKDNKSNRYCQNRLQYLSEIDFIKRTRSTIDSGYSYYIDKKSKIDQIHHNLIRTELYTCIKKQYNLLEWINEYNELEHIRPDAFCFIRYNGLPYPVFVEIHLSNDFNFEKYNNVCKNYNLKLLYGIIPRVLICTDKKLKIPKMDLQFKVVDIGVNGLESLFN